jgi:hypothetical protein
VEQDLVQDVQLEQINNLINLVKPNFKQNILKLSPKYYLKQRFSSFWYLRICVPQNQPLSAILTFVVPPQAVRVPPGVRIPKVENCWFILVK